MTHDDSASYTLTTNNGSSDEARNMILNVAGTLTAARNVVVPTASKLYVVKNATVGGFAITVKTSAGTGISVPNGKTMVLFCDGTNVVKPDHFAGAMQGVTVARSANTILTAEDCGKTLLCTGSWTQTFTAAATLGDGWWVEIVNIGTGTITLDPNGAEKVYIPGGASGGDATMTLPYSGSTEGPYNVSGVVLKTDGSHFYATSTREAHGEQLFTASGTWTCPAGVTTIFVDGSAQGGGGGGCAAAVAYAGGGGGGQAVLGSRQAVVPGTAYTVTITTNANGAAAGNNSGTAGATCSFGALISLTGGNGGQGSGGGATGGAEPGGTGGGAGGLGQTGVSGGIGGGGIFAAPAFNTGLVTSNGRPGTSYGGGGQGGVSGGGATASGGQGGPGFFRVRW